MSNNLFLEERRRAIMQRLEHEGRVTVRGLSEEMHVSAVTIRQDLRALEEQGLLQRTYGGAVARTGAGRLKELSFNVRLQKNRAEKRAIAAFAAQFIERGYSVALDSSTTAYALLPHLKQLDKLTIVTNGLMLAQGFLDRSDFQVLVTGGRLRNDSISLVGMPESLPNINLNVGFFSARGLAEGAGITEIDPDEVEIKQAMIARCVRAIYLLDGSKWGEIAPYTITPLERAQHIITTEDAPPDMVARLRECGIRVDVVEVGEQKNADRLTHPQTVGR